MPSSSFVSLTSWQAPRSTQGLAPTDLSWVLSVRTSSRTWRQPSEDVSTSLRLSTWSVLTTAASPQQAAGLKHLSNGESLTYRKTAENMNHYHYVLIMTFFIISNPLFNIIIQLKYLYSDKGHGKHEKYRDWKKITSPFLMTRCCCRCNSHSVYCYSVMFVPTY